jgi:GNAT superfamily N-acetyltransferase
VKPRRPQVRVRNTTRDDLEDIIELSRRVYPGSHPWSARQLMSHLKVFPRGQFVAERDGFASIAGMSASLILHWEDYETTATWKEFTGGGMFVNHDPARGRTLYGAEVMVDPSIQRSGVGAALYRARRRLAIELGLVRIRAAARLRGYHRYAHRMSPEQYVEGVLRGTLKGPTLSFQLREGFQVIQVVSNYLDSDPESLGHAAIIEWLNPTLVREEDFAGRSDRFLVPPRMPGGMLGTSGGAGA